MSETPETDAEAITPSGFEDDDVSAEFARKLERERDEARDAIVGWENKWRCAVDMAARAELERNEAQEKYNNLATEHMLVVNKLAGERDEAVEEVRRLKIILDLIKKEAQ